MLGCRSWDPSSSSSIHGKYVGEGLREFLSGLSPSVLIHLRDCECRGIVNTYGVFQTYYTSNLLNQESPSNISWVGSIGAFLLLIIGVATGPIYDAGYFRTLVAVGSFLVVFGMMMTSICKSYWEVMLAQGLCVGLGSGCLFIPSVAIVSTYFTTKKAFATGVAAAGSSLGEWKKRPACPRSPLES